MQEGMSMSWVLQLPRSVRLAHVAAARGGGMRLSWRPEMGAVAGGPDPRPLRRGTLPEHSEGPPWLGRPARSQPEASTEDALSGLQGASADSDGADVDAWPSLGHHDQDQRLRSVLRLLLFLGHHLLRLLLLSEAAAAAAACPCPCLCPVSVHHGLPRLVSCACKTADSAVLHGLLNHVTHVLGGCSCVPGDRSGTLHAFFRRALSALPGLHLHVVCCQAHASLPQFMARLCNGTPPEIGEVQGRIREPCPGVEERACRGCKPRTMFGVCLAADHMLMETSGQRTPLCTHCERQHGACHFCRRVHSCTPPAHTGTQPQPQPPRPCASTRPALIAKASGTCQRRD